MRHNVEAMASVGSPSTRIVGVGGGTRSGALPQVVTDVLGRQQSICDPSVGASFGSAILAARAASMIEDAGDWIRVDRILTPEPSTANVYAEAIRIAHTSTFPRRGTSMTGMRPGA